MFLVRNIPYPEAATSIVGFTGALTKLNPATP